MKYVNLTKRNTSKFNFISKRIASVSLLCLVLTAAVVVPLSSVAKDVKVEKQNQIIDLDDEYVLNEELNS